jgi:hypothetical protein
MLANPERLFERSWRPRHPLRREHCAARRRCMAGLLCLLAIVIFGYIYITDAQRVRAMASSYLSELLGGEVTIGKANLSIFEGLRLDDVTLRVDKSNQPDSIIFHARSFLLRYHPTELLAGRLSATQIIAIDPVVMLVEDPQTERWNYQRLWNGNGPPKRTEKSSSGENLVLPQIILRDAEVAYMEFRNGKTVPVGWYSIEGSLNPSEEEPDRYDFQLQSRGRESMGPSMDGILRTQGGISVAHMQNFSFGPDIKTMLLAEPRQWCEWHQLQGRIDVPEMVYDPNIGGGGPIFHAELVLSNVEMAIHPEEWMSKAQNERVKWLHSFLDKAVAKKWIRPGLADALRRLSTPQPVRFSQVSGNLIFNEHGIQLKAITGKVESNWFNIDGALDGYSPDAPAHLTISSVTGHDLEIPEISPDYLGTLPRELQDVIEHLRPRGTCAIQLNIDRPEPGGKPDVSGRMDVKDGNFCFSDIPYPVSHIRGAILLGPDLVAHMRGVRLLNIQGHGPESGPNANASLTVNGFIGPLEGVAGFAMQIDGSDVEGDQQLRAALPADARRALQNFDPEGHGQLPRFHGDFTCHVTRDPGPRKPVKINFNGNMQDFEGTLVAFPYPLNHVKGRINIQDGYLTLSDAEMHRGDGTVRIDGTVTWQTSNPNPKPPFGPDMHITVRNLPIDDNLKNALPPMQRAWAQNSGLSGQVDMDGHLWPLPKGDKVTYSFIGRLHDGAIQSADEAAMSGLTAKLRLTPTQLEIADLTGRRGTSELSARALLDWSTEPRVTLSAAARNLELNESLYRVLPRDARNAWDSVKPHGDIDGTLELSETLGEVPDRLELHITPRQLSVTPAPLPYRLDGLQGEILVSPTEVVLNNLNAVHGPANISVSGRGRIDKRQTWDLKIAATKLNPDSELLAALPSSIAGVLRGMKVDGPLDVDISKLAYWPAGQPDPMSSDAATQPIASSTTHPADNTDVDFAAKITLNGNTLDVGLPITDAHGRVDLAGLIRDGRLHRLAGQAGLDYFQLAGRPASELRFELAKRTDDPQIDITHVQGKFAAGDLAGQGDYIFPDTGPSRYDINLVLRDADVQQITPRIREGLKGHLTASLQLGGIWDDPTSRRGHGDVNVSGERMYDIPVMLGLMQITSLALPVTSPFNEISTRYTLEGQKVIFDQINLKSKDMTMIGSGEMNFDTQNVSLWLSTTNPTLVGIPVLGPLLTTANQELLRIHVKGKIDKPTVAASAFNSVATTVDEVFKGTDQENR